MLALLVALALQEDPLDRLIGQLRSAPETRRPLLEFAVRAHGEAALPRLEKAGIDPAFLSGEIPVLPEDEEITRKLNLVRLSLDQQNASFADLFKHLQETTGLRFSVDRRSLPDIDERRFTFKVQDLSLINVLKLLLGASGLDFVVRGGGIIVCASEAGAVQGILPPRQPVRLPGDGTAARKLLAALESASLEERERTAEAIRGLGFAAEPALWEALDSPEAETRAQAGDLLRRLYGPAARPASPPLFDAEVELEAKNAPLAQLLEAFSRNARTAILVDSREVDLARAAWVVAGKFRVEEALRLYLVPGKALIPMEGGAFITSEKAPIHRRPGAGTIWAAPEVARRLELLFADLASDEAPRRRAAETALLETGEPAYLPLVAAEEAVAKDLAPRFRSLRFRLQDRLKAWLAGEPSGAELQTLTDAQKTLLARKLPPPKGETLDAILTRAGIKHLILAPCEATLASFGGDVGLLPLLRSATRPSGLDFHLDGETVVVNAAVKVRAALGR